MKSMLEQVKYQIQATLEDKVYIENSPTDSFSKKSRLISELFEKRAKGIIKIVVEETKKTT